MNKRYLLYIPILLLSSVLLVGCTKKDIDYDSSKIDIVGSDEKVEEEKEKEPEEEESKESDDLGYLSNPDEFTKAKQSIGTLTESEYTLESLQDTQSNGYHSFNFNISTTAEAPSLPSFSVEPVLDKGVYRVTIGNVVKDSSGIAYQQSRAIDKGAITGIYRAVTSVPKTAVYEIGFLGSNTFKLDYIETTPSNWDISVKVSYDLKYSPPTIDFGSSEFSSDEQTITGMESSDGAKISTYSYSVTGNTLKFVFSVASGASNPIPSVQAKYEAENILEVKFPSLLSDKVPTWGGSITLPAGITVAVSRAGDTSVYRFGGIGGLKPFKLSASQSPNQVILEIETN